MRIFYRYVAFPSHLRRRSNIPHVQHCTTQCAIAAFEGLIPPEHGDRVQDLLFIFAHWHALAKLKLHTDDTLSLLDDWTVMLGSESRSFVDKTCSAFETRELKREYQARKRNEARKKGATVAADSTKPANNLNSPTSAPGVKSVAKSRAKKPTTKQPAASRAKNTKSKTKAAVAIPTLPSDNGECLVPEKGRVSPIVHVFPLLI